MSVDVRTVDLKKNENLNENGKFKVNGVELLFTATKFKDADEKGFTILFKDNNDKKVSYYKLNPVLEEFVFELIKSEKEVENCLKAPCKILIPDEIIIRTKLPEHKESGMYGGDDTYNDDGDDRGTVVQVQESGFPSPIAI